MLRPRGLWCTFCIFLLLRGTSGIRSPSAKLRGRRVVSNAVARAGAARATPVEQLLVDLKSMRARTKAVADQLAAVQARAFSLEAYVGRITDNASSVLQEAVGAAKAAHLNKGIVGRLREREAILNGSALNTTRFTSITAGITAMAPEFTDVQASIDALPDHTDLTDRLNASEEHIAAFQKGGSLDTQRNKILEEINAYRKDVNDTVIKAVEDETPAFINSTVAGMNNMSSFTNLLGTPMPYPDPPCCDAPTWPPPNAAAFNTNTTAAS